MKGGELAATSTSLSDQPPIPLPEPRRYAVISNEVRNLFSAHNPYFTKHVIVRRKTRRNLFFFYFNAILHAINISLVAHLRLIIKSRFFSIVHFTLQVIHFFIYPYLNVLQPRLRHLECECLQRFLAREAVQVGIIC